MGVTAQLIVLAPQYEFINNFVPPQYEFINNFVLITIINGRACVTFTPKFT